MQAQLNPNRVRLPSGQEIFVVGFNLAWIHFARDVGESPLNTVAFEAAARAVAEAGGNTMRVWLYTNGGYDLPFGADGLVSGMGEHTLANVRNMFAIAQRHNLLLMPVLLTHNFMQRQPGVDLERNTRLLTTQSGLEAFIQKAVVPLVKAIGTHPNLLCWEIANEPEGMTEAHGWTDGRISGRDVQIFTNQICGAIRRAVPEVLVSTGTVIAARLDWYTDKALIEAGGDEQGILDFYMIHYYGWNGPQNSPFHTSAAEWGMDKPIVVGEFASSSWDPSLKSSVPIQDTETVDGLLETLLAKGYAGGLFWQYQPDEGDPWMSGFSTAAPSMTKFALAHPEVVKKVRRA